MRKLDWFRLVVFSVLAFVSAWAQADASSDQKEAEMFAKKKFPSVKIDAVVPSEAKSWYVASSGDQLIYIEPKQRLVFQGVLIDADKHVNLTEKMKNTILQNAMKNFPVKNAIVYRNGNGSRHLIAFEDPYCKYCRTFTEEVSTLTNATVYVVLYPVLRKDSLHMAEKIWCSKNRARAWHRWMINNEEPKSDGKCVTPLKKNLDLGRLYSVSGTPTIFLMNGKRLPGVPSAEEIDRQLDTL